MEDDLSSEIIKATQVSLGKYIKRPPLSEKLLRKPPFRFLHDIITTVLKTTGFFEGLFEENELISENVKDRDSKILFLNKVIWVLSKATGKPLSAKPSKIVAGQEPEKTNDLLQCLAQALDDNLSSNEAIKAYKENAKSPRIKEQIQAKTNNTKKIIKKTKESKNVERNEKITNHDKEANEKRIKTKDKDQNETTIKKKEVGVIKNESQNKIISQSKTLVKKTKVENKLKAINQSGINQSQPSVKTITSRKNENTEKTENIQMQHLEDQLEKEEFNSHDNVKSNTVQIATINKCIDNDLITLPLGEEIIQSENLNTKSNDLTANTTQKDDMNINISNDNNVHLEADNKNLTQNYTPKISDYDKSNHENEESERTNYSSEKKIVEKISNSPKATSNQNIDKPFKIRPSSSRPGAPRPREKFENYVSDSENIVSGKVNIIAEHSQNEEEEDSSIIILEENTLTENLDVSNQNNLSSEHTHGHLVQQILNSKKELSQVTAKTEIEWQFGLQKAKDAQSQDIDLLRHNIQGLSRIANPLGKLLDHIQEDVEVMRQELQQWIAIYEEVSQQMLKQKTFNEGTLLPLHSKLKHIEEEVQEKHKKINDLKVLINKNNSRIEKLIAVPSISIVI